MQCGLTLTWTRRPRHDGARHLALYACDLAQCTGLKELHVAALLNGSSNLDMFLCMARFLSRVRAPGITAVVFSFVGGVPGGPLGNKPVTHLDSLAAALEHNGAFGALERVVVRLSEGWGRIQEREYASIRGALRRIEDRGLLRIEVEEERDEQVRWSLSCALRISSNAYLVAPSEEVGVLIWAPGGVRPSPPPCLRPCPSVST